MNDLPLADQLVAKGVKVAIEAERHRVVSLAKELEKHGKLTAKMLEAFAGMELQVTKPELSVERDENGTTVRVDHDARLGFNAAHAVAHMALHYRDLYEKHVADENHTPMKERQ